MVWYWKKFLSKFINNIEGFLDTAKDFFYYQTDSHEGRKSEM